MSRGLGRVQRLIIEKLAPRHTGYVPSMPARSLLKSMNRAEFGAGPEPIRPVTRESLYQALESLERRGIVTRSRTGPVTEWSLAEVQRREADRQRKHAAQAARRKKARQRQQEQARQQGDGAEATPPRPKSRHRYARLARLLEMLSSEYDGEVLNAARAVEAERRQLGVTWETLLDPVGAFPDPLPFRGR